MDRKNIYKNDTAQSGRKMTFVNLVFHHISKKARKYDQEMPKSHTIDQLTLQRLGLIT